MNKYSIELLCRQSFLNDLKNQFSSHKYSFFLHSKTRTKKRNKTRLFNEKKASLKGFLDF
ncbi:MAG TPA: hypothetical protein DCZ41_02525 [Firmicutes bacterium]|nr:hypothetical protein [Bacillota bacterium]